MGQPAPCLTRFAPAPTGPLHLGHVVNAIYVWGMARARGGRVLLRIEDHDRQRTRPELERALLDDLDWLGFVPDIYPTDAYRHGACEARQSERDAIYRAALQPLIEQGLVYGCTCSRREIEAVQTGQTAPNARTAEPPTVRRAEAPTVRRAEAPTVRRAEASASARPGLKPWPSVPEGPAPEDSELHYPGTCRDRAIPLSNGVGWRVRMHPGGEHFVDELQGAQVQDPLRQCGDLLVRDRVGNWTYQLAVVVDDWQQEIDLVIRGADLLASTGRQIRLARMLGRHSPPRFAHHALVMKSADRKLSKSDGDAGVAVLRDAGWTPDRVIGHAATIVGLQREARPLTAGSVAGLFRS
jgi:glutamyl/glutaminyl-tRNA synthetase